MCGPVRRRAAGRGPRAPRDVADALERIGIDALRRRPEQGRGGIHQ